MNQTAAALLAATILAPPAAADTLDDARARGVLVWGADRESGGPYVYPRDDDPSEIAGFEVELAAALGRRLGFEMRFFQGPWDRMLDLLRSGEIDVVLNGYEWSAERAEVAASTIPYYVYALQMLVREDHSRRSLAMPARVGVPVGSAAETWLDKHPFDGLEVARYDGNTDAMREVETGKLDATLQETPIVGFYGPRFPRLQPLGEPVGRGHYVMYARRDDARLVAAIDDALIRMIRSGELEALYRRWGLWNEAQSELVRIAEAGEFHGPSASATAPVAGSIVRSTDLTVLFSIVSFALAIAVGLAIARGRRGRPTFPRRRRSASTHGPAELPHRAAPMRTRRP